MGLSVSRSNVVVFVFFFFLCSNFLFCHCELRRKGPDIPLIPSEYDRREATIVKGFFTSKIDNDGSGTVGKYILLKQHYDGSSGIA